MEDREIVDLYWQRDERAIAETAARYGTYCSSIATNILRQPEDVEESVNDTWMNAWNSMPPHRPEVLPSFLGKITRYICLKNGGNAMPRSGAAERRRLFLRNCQRAFPTGRALTRRYRQRSWHKS